MSLQVESLADARAAYVYRWPAGPELSSNAWRPSRDDRYIERQLPESTADLELDSRWPAFFPSAMALVTASDGSSTVLERVVGVSIVNRFPYILAVSVCRVSLSSRHYVRSAFATAVERSSSAVVQFLPPGPALNRALHAIASTPDGLSAQRIKDAGLRTRGSLVGAPILEDATLAFEGVQVPGDAGLETPPFLDVGSHRVYLFEVRRIHLRESIAIGSSQIRWRSLPRWTARRDFGRLTAPRPAGPNRAHFIKGYSADYQFPAPNTVAFDYNRVLDGMAVMDLPPFRGDVTTLRLGNDEARWPCFFPAPLGMITSWAPDGQPNLMPCGSTTMMSRQPLTIAPAICYRGPNERYTERASLDMIRRNGRFTCGVPYIDEDVLEAIRYAGNVSWTVDPDKVVSAGLLAEPNPWAPRLPLLPVHFECEVVGEHRLGTHALVLGEVKRIVVRADVSADNPLEWCPWADLTSGTEL